MRTDPGEQALGRRAQLVQVKKEDLGAQGLDLGEEVGPRHRAHGAKPAVAADAVSQALAEEAILAGNQNRNAPAALHRGTSRGGLGASYSSSELIASARAARIDSCTGSVAPGAASVSVSQSGAEGRSRSRAGASEVARFWTLGSRSWRVVPFPTSLRTRRIPPIDSVLYRNPIRPLWEDSRSCSKVILTSKPTPSSEMEMAVPCSWYATTTRTQEARACLRTLVNASRTM